MVLEQLETVSGNSFATIRIIGGGAQNVLLNQFTADATGRSVMSGPTEATALGNVAMQMLACGAVKTIEEARQVIEASTHQQRFEPSGAGSWDRVYERFRSTIESPSDSPYKKLVK
jgi:sugar (pentulose or hexulose) kinase